MEICTVGFLFLEPFMSSDSSKHFYDTPLIGSYTGGKHYGYGFKEVMWGPVSCWSTLPHAECRGWGILGTVDDPSAEDTEPRIVPDGYHFGWAGGADI